MFSETALKNADACRFCWMCRHLCPVSLKTGKEINSARARGLLVSMVDRGTEYDESMAKNMWECVLCGSCSDDCASGYDPRIFIREGRSIALAEGIAPKNIAALADNFLSTGNMYGEKDIQKNLKKEISKLPEHADIILYIGEVSYIETPYIAKALINLLNKSGIRFTILKNEPSSGAYMGDFLGYVDDVHRQALKLSAALNESGAKTVIVIDPMDARIIKHEYAEWNCSPNPDIVTATSYISGLLEKGILTIPKERKTCSIHDASALCRDLNETAPIRNILAYIGYEIHEMLRCKNLAKSSGGALLKQYDPVLSKLVAEGRWEDLTRLNLNIMISEAPGSYVALSQCIPDGCTLKDIFVLLDELST